MTFFWCLYRGLLSFSPAALCSRISGLSPKQKKLCIESPDAVVALGNGHALGARECQHQLAGRLQEFFLSWHLTKLTTSRASMELLRSLEKRCFWTCDSSRWVKWIGFETRNRCFDLNQRCWDEHKLADSETWLIFIKTFNGNHLKKIDKLNVIFMEITTATMIPTGIHWAMGWSDTFVTYFSIYWIKYRSIYLSMQILTTT